MMEGIPSYDEDPILWRHFALCRGDDTDHWFPERNESSTHARNTCRACPVQEQCLDDALATNEKFGIRAGLSERDRRSVRRRRAEERRAS